MMEISYEYWNKLASQTITISSLLGGFSIAIIANLIVSEFKTRLHQWILVASTFAACFLLLAVFAMTAVILQTTEGYPLAIVEEDFKFDRMAGAISFMFGIFSLFVIIALAGWMKSKRMGIFTTVTAILTLIMTFVFMS